MSASTAPTPAPAATRPREPAPGALPPPVPWHSRVNARTVTLAAFALGVVVSLPAARGPERELDYLGNAARLAGYFLRPDFGQWDRIWRALVETAQIAVLATAAAALLSLPLALAGARTVSPRWLVWAARMLMNVIRTVPSLVWAVLAVAVVGLNPLAGVGALTLYSVGYLGKFFSDAFESVDPGVSRALRALGAGRVQAFQHGLWPLARPLVWSHVLWMLEYNVRSAAIIGYVGAGGVGTLLATYVEYHDWAKFAAVLWVILLLVTLLDLVGEWTRGQLGGGRAPAPPKAGQST